MNKQQGFIAALMAVIFGFLFVLMSIFGFWAFNERSKYKTDTDAIVADAVEIAVNERETELENEFLEREKLPTRKFVGSKTYGSVTFDYPKTWSVYEYKDGNDAVMDIYSHPGVVPGGGEDDTYALRVELLTRGYDDVVASLNDEVKNGLLKSKTYRPAQLPEVKGLQYSGQIRPEVQGLKTVLPLRDKTLVISSESDQFFNDYSNIVLKSMTFIP